MLSGVVFGYVMVLFSFAAAAFFLGHVNVPVVRGRDRKGGGWLVQDTVQVRIYM